MRRLLEDIRMHLPARHTKVVRVMPSAVEMNAGCAPRCRYTCICTCTVHHRTLAPVLPKTVGTRFCLHASVNAPRRACVADLVTEKALHKKYNEFIQHFSNPPGGNPLARWAYNRRGQQLKVQCVAMT